MARAPQTAILLWLALGAGLAHAGGPRVVSIEPARRGGLLVCRLSTADLPGERITSTLASGLVSAIDLYLDLLDGDDHQLAGNVVRLRLGYDLWDEVFTVDCGDEVTQLPDLAALRTWLQDPPWLPVAPLNSVERTTPLRLRAALRLYAIAPSERERVGAMVAGPDGQEVSVGLSRLIRLFYRGAARHDDVVGQALSATFRKEDLRDAAD